MLNPNLGGETTRWSRHPSFSQRKYTSLSHCGDEKGTGIDIDNDIG